MKLLATGIIASGAAGKSTASCCFPAIAQLSDRSLLASWRTGTTKESGDGKIHLARSTDQGARWTHWPLDLNAVFDDTPGEYHYGPITVLDDGRLLIALMWTDRSQPALPFFNPQTEGLLPIRTVFAESTDAGVTWHSVRRMDMAPYHSPMPITGAVLNLPGERLGCQFEVNKDYSDPRPWRHAAALKISSDAGKTWPHAIEVANDPDNRLMYWDQRHTILGNTCIATFWTYDRQHQRDANIHISYSTDANTWTPPRDTGIVGQVAHPVLLSNNRLVLVYIDRFNSRSIRAKLSLDGGKSFAAEDLVIYEQPGSSPDQGTKSDAAEYLQDMQLWTFGRIDAIPDPNGDIWVVYYAGTEKSTDIRWARIAL